VFIIGISGFVWKQRTSTTSTRTRSVRREKKSTVENNARLYKKNRLIAQKITLAPNSQE
jgi:hypothetical protein